MSSGGFARLVEEAAAELRQRGGSTSQPGPMAKGGGLTGRYYADRVLLRPAPQAFKPNLGEMTKALNTETARLAATAPPPLTRAQRLAEVQARTETVLTKAMSLFHEGRLTGEQVQLLEIHAHRAIDAVLDTPQ